jgi:hypothetical protein
MSGKVKLVMAFKNTHHAPIKIIVIVPLHILKGTKAVIEGTVAVSV